ncbi:hypothetical protein QOT17_015605 [Balamuthia mandrillaris]
MLDNKGLTVKELWQKIEDLGGQWTTKDTKSVLSHKLQTLQTPMLNLSSNQPSDLLETDEGSSSSPSNSAPTRNDWILCESDLEAVHLFCAPDSVNKETKEVAELCKTRLQEGTCLVPLKAITMKVQISPSAHLLHRMAQLSLSNPPVECGQQLEMLSCIIWHSQYPPQFFMCSILSFDECSSLLLMELPSALWVHPESNQQEYVCLGGNHRYAAAHVLYCENSPKLITWRAKVLPFDGKQLLSVAALDKLSAWDNLVLSKGVNQETEWDMNSQIASQDAHNALTFDRVRRLKTVANKMQKFPESWSYIQEKDKEKGGWVFTPYHFREKMPSSLSDETLIGALKEIWARHLENPKKECSVTNFKRLMWKHIGRKAMHEELELYHTEKEIPLAHLEEVQDQVNSGKYDEEFFEKQGLSGDTAFQQAIQVCLF